MSFKSRSISKSTCTAITAMFQYDQCYTNFQLRKCQQTLSKITSLCSWCSSEGPGGPPMEDTVDIRQYDIEASNRIASLLPMVKYFNLFTGIILLQILKINIHMCFKRI